MAENEKSENKKSKLPVIIIAACAVIIALLAVLIFMLLGKEDKEPYDPVSANMSNGVLKYDEAALALNEEDLQRQVNEMVEKAEDGYITLSYKTMAESTDGKNFECYIGNAIDNKYDMYINIYKDNTAQEQILLTGLIPPGRGISSFESEIQLEKGVYDALLVITQVEDDHETIRDNQLLVTYSLVVR